MVKSPAILVKPTAVLVKSPGCALVTLGSHHPSTSLEPSWGNIAAPLYLVRTYPRASSLL